MSTAGILKSLAVQCRDEVKKKNRAFRKTIFIVIPTFQEPEP